MFIKGFKKIAWDASQGKVNAPQVDPAKVKSMGFTKTFGDGKGPTGLANLNTMGGLIPKGIF